MTREEIESRLAGLDGNDWPHFARPSRDTIRALCELALEGLALRAENERLQRERDEALAHEDGLRAENERLRTVLSQIALYTDKPECFEIADMAKAALERKPE